MVVVVVIVLVVVMVVVVLVLVVVVVVVGSEKFNGTGKWGGGKEDGKWERKGGEKVIS